MRCRTVSSSTPTFFAMAPKDVRKWAPIGLEAGLWSRSLKRRTSRASKLPPRTGNGQDHEIPFGTREWGLPARLGLGIPNCSIGRPKGWSSDSIANRRGDGEETGDGQDDRDAGQAAEGCNDQRDSIRQRSDTVLARDGVRLLVGDSTSEKTTPGGAIPPETVPYDRQHEERTRVQRGGDIRIGSQDVIGDHGCVEHGGDHEGQGQTNEGDQS